MQFLVFFPVVIALYFSTPYRFRCYLLLAASYYFYMCWKPEYIFLIIISTIIDYYAGMQMSKHAERRKKRKYLALSIFSNLGILFGFKYFNFFNESIRSVFDHFNIFYGIAEFNILLPVGISFYTFQTLSYSIDVYRGIQKPEPHLGRFALYVSFFPQLVAGPIERSTRLLPQFYQKYDFDYTRVVSGLKLILWGLFKKLVIADRLAILVDPIYNNPTNYQGFIFIVATVWFAFQIYCDFSGYSDIAIGSAQIMGFSLMDNFDRPYFSKSISEFWRRWHISLSTWFRDYLYIPLGGNKVSKSRWYCNVFTVFLVSGLWHGANWTFVIWGALHGFYLIVGILTEPIRRQATELLGLNRIPFILKLLRVTLTFSLVCFAWIFFRANTISDALYIITHIHTGFWNYSVNLNQTSHGLWVSVFDFAKNLSIWEILIVIFSLAFLEIVHLIERHRKISDVVREKHITFRWAFYYLTTMIILLFGAYSENQQFIYFQF